MPRMRTNGRWAAKWLTAPGFSSAVERNLRAAALCPPGVDLPVKGTRPHTMGHSVGRGQNYPDHHEGGGVVPHRADMFSTGEPLRDNLEARTPPLEGPTPTDGGRPPRPAD